ncbi:MAG: thioredoxin domain-containing protein [Planctomycetes bacterium]|nr:thioredoxin domain-containing protein [Planctomycetota bacterium]
MMLPRAARGARLLIAAALVGPDEAATRGPANAPVTIVEFSDFQCPSSRKASRAVRELFARHPGKVRWVFKSFPLPFHRQAPLAHEAALAAGEWGLFWEMHDGIFKTQESLDRARLVDLAAGLGIPAADFELVLDSRAFSRAVAREAEEGRSLGVTGTPTFLVNGLRLVGAQPAEALDHVVRRALGLETAAAPDLPAEILLEDPEPAHPLAFGPKEARVVAKVFVDLRSPLGLKAARAAKDVLDRHAGEVRLVFKLLATGIYADSGTAHEAAAAIAKRGAGFFDVWSRIARTQGTIHAGSAAAMASEAGLGEEAAREVEREVRQGAHRALVEADGRLARRLGIKGSPAVVVGGRRLDGLAGIVELGRLLEAGGAGPPGAAAARAGEPIADRDAASRCDPALPPPGLAASAAGISAPPGPPAGPGVPVHDFGAAALGAAVRHVFELRNDGPRPLKVTSVTAPPALEVRRVPREVAPGAAERLEMALITGWASGAIEVSLRLETDDPARPALVFGLRGIVSEEVQVHPAGGLSLRAVAGEAAEAAAELHIEGGEPREASVAGTDVAGLEVVLEPVLPGRRHRLRARLGPRAAVGELRGLVTLRTSHPRVQEVLVPVEAIVLPEIAVTPPVLVVRDPSKPLHVTLESSRGTPFTVRQARSDLPFLRLVPLPAPPGPRQRVEIRVDAGWLPAAAARGEVRLALEGVGEPAGALREVAVPVEWAAGAPR